MEHKQELGQKKPKKPIRTDNAHPLPKEISPSTLESSTTTTAEVSAPTTTMDAVVDDEQDVSFFHDFIAGGVAGCASVVVGHPLDSIKVRIQTTAAGGSASISSVVTGYGGVSSLFRGMSAPLSTACIINAIIFSSYGWSSRLYDEHMPNPICSTNNTPLPHDSTLKAFTCGSFAGLVQALVICPQEHIKCRLQIQHGKGSADNVYKGPIQATRSIVQQYGLRGGLFRGWWITCWREVPAFGAYFACYDIFKDRINAFFVERDERLTKDEQRQRTLDGVAPVDVTATDDNFSNMTMAHHAHTWLSSALAGGLTGALTWAFVYPFDVIKTRIQTMPLDTPLEDRRIVSVTRNLVQQYGWKHLTRGLGITCFRAFPVNGIIFPVYEYTLMHVCALEY